MELETKWIKRTVSWKDFEAAAITPDTGNGARVRVGLYTLNRDKNEILLRAVLQPSELFTSQQPDVQRLKASIYPFNANNISMCEYSFEDPAQYGGFVNPQCYDFTQGVQNFTNVFGDFALPNYRGIELEFFLSLNSGTAEISSITQGEMQVYLEILTHSKKRR